MKPSAKFRLFALAVASTLVGGLLVGAPQQSAQAASSVTIKKIPTVRAGYTGKAKVKPSYKSGKGVAVSSARLTVKKGRTVVKKNATSASLKPGKYSVTTTLKYRNSTLTNKNLTLARGRYLAGYYEGYPTGGFYTPGDCKVVSVDPESANPRTAKLSCAVRWAVDDRNIDRFFGNAETTAYVETIDFGEGEVYYQFIVEGMDLFFNESPDTNKAEDFVGYTGYLQAGMTVEKSISNSVPVLTYGKTQTAKRSQKLTVLKGRTCATYSDFKKVAVDFDQPSVYGTHKSDVARILHGAGVRNSYTDDGEGQIIESRYYRTCDKSASLYVIFENNWSYAKRYSK
ncbi:hypothetical protein ABIE44_002685 [Marmoricola sp. OAE513]|uniref:hypothetical protein n=1 Tax=Marmoricola sp. OAE513 TaxID=2817894 RepID=UPI001AE5734A